MAPYTWTVREGSLDGPVIMREYIYDVPDKEPVEGQELYLSNGSGPWRVSLRELVPAMPRSPYNVLVVERVEKSACRTGRGRDRRVSGSVVARE